MTNQVDSSGASVAEQLRRQRDEASTLMPTPWPDLTQLAELNFRHKVGIIAQRGTREAKVGRDVAVHAANTGLPVVLFTGYPPSTQPKTLVVKEIPDPTDSHVNAAAKIHIEGQTPRLIVIERYERLTREPHEPYSEPMHDLIDEVSEEESWGDRLMWTVRNIRVNIPVLLTTVVDEVPDLARPLGRWLHIDHPANVMTDVCKPTIVLARSGSESVEARLEVDPHEYRSGERSTLAWKPLPRSS
ncbi:hypothetical protein [Streptomyces yunnanensis]|uniref:Uncharacterized protein n=1 Tax=Streptomyces yunnanensis TaxID=156453 RepID=A0A9X8N9E0_9ACTN|nr:hypothetical protein [Streptomyces yunnanensis]SHN32799.1 hypothetical protein SAMN05216268_13718 [Streptomyces yunnanensis]